MRRPLVLLTLGAVLGCATHGPESLVLEIVDEQSGATEQVHQPYADEASVDEVDEPPLECLPEGFVARAPVVPSHAPEPSSGKCWSPPRATRVRTAADVRETWFYAVEGARLDVDFGCDRLADIEEIVVQFGSGHGGTLDLLRLRAGPDDWELLLLRASDGYYPEVDELPAGTYRGRVSDQQVAEALSSARAAMLVEASEIIPPASNTAAGSSSGDFHAFVRLIDGSGRARDVAFSGYPSSDDQLDWIVPELGGWSLYQLIEASPLAPVAADDDSRTFFMERFAEAEARDYYGEFGAWWVHERLLMMAGAQASLDLLPALGSRLCPDPDGVRSSGREGARALRSMFALLGRSEAIEIDEREQLRAEQAARWIEACEIKCR